MRRLTLIVPTLVGSLSCSWVAGCGDDAAKSDVADASATTPDVAPTDVSDTQTPLEETGPDVVTVDSADATGQPEVTGDSVVPSYVDPLWTEPSAPARAAIDTRVTAIRSAAAGRVGQAGLDALASATSTMAPEVAAHAYLQNGYFDAARILLADAATKTTHAAPWIALAAIELLDPAGDLAVAADLARFSLSELGSTHADRIVYDRLRASAWNNLGLALLRGGEGAGAVNAYRHAVAFFPSDAAYRTGLAAALAKTGLVLPALVEARRAVALEKLAPGRSSLGPTPASVWKTHLEAELRKGIAMPANAPAPVIPADDPVGDFPAAGTSWLGFFVLESSPDGSFKTTPPPFEGHGSEHASGAALECVQVSPTVVDLDCPKQPAGQWFEPALIGPHVEPRVNEEGLTCGNVVQRTFEAEARDLDVDPASASLASQVTALGRVVLDELLAIQSSFGVPNGNANAIERCKSFLSVADGYENAFDIVTTGCSCACDEEACQQCWSNYLNACDALYDIASGLVTSELARVQADNVAIQQNDERYLAMLVPFMAYGFNKTTCDADCATIVSLSPVFGWAERIGGRTPALLSHMVTLPPTKYLQCLKAAPSECGGPPAEVAESQAGDVPCVCLGAGLFEICIQADGTMEVKASAIIAVGTQFNLKEGISSLRLGVGTDIGLNLGPVAFGVSQMAWWDASSDVWTAGDVEWDMGVAGPSGSGIGGGPGLCDAWKDDAPPRESAPEGLAVEVTSDGPPVE